MKEKKTISDLKDGWKKITDMLRATYTCTTCQQVLSVLKCLFNNSIIKVLTIVPRFGIEKPHLNDMIITFDFKG